jgi:phage antirepressor YoqD-like protein
VKELVENYFVPKLRGNTRKCEKYYCKNCLRNIYDIDVTEIKKKSFQCPSCSNRCICSRCIRYENLIKQIAYYLNNFGDIDKLYDYLVKQNSIFEKLKDNLVIRKFICVDFSAKNYPSLKFNSSANSTGKKGANGVGNNFLDLLKYKKNLENLQFDFCDIYDEANLKQQLYDAEFLKIKESNVNNSNSKEVEKTDKKNQKLIGRKLKNPSIRKK